MYMCCLEWSASSNTLERLSTHTLTDCWLWRCRLVQWTKPLWGTQRSDPVFNAYYHIIEKYMFTMIQTIEGDNSVLLRKGHLKILNIERNLHHLQFISSGHTCMHLCRLFTCLYESLIKMIAKHGMSWVWQLFGHTVTKVVHGQSYWAGCWHSLRSEGITKPGLSAQDCMTIHLSCKVG